MGSLLSSQKVQKKTWLSRRNEFSAQDPEWDKFYENHKADVPSLYGPVHEVRQIMSNVKMKGQGAAQSIVEGLVTQNHAIHTAHGADITLRTYTPTKSRHQDGFPAMLYFHGGGFALGDLDGEDRTCRLLCVSNGIVVVSVDYRLAPENPYPAALNDSWDSLDWLLKHAIDLGVDSTRILVGGTSAGANLAAVLANGAKARGISVHGQLLRIPVVSLSQSHLKSLGLHSMDEFCDAPILSRNALAQFLEWYRPPDVADPSVSPILEPSLKDTSRAFLQLCGCDPLRDEGLAYTDALEAAGVPTRLNVYHGVPHAFWIFPQVPQTKVALEDMVKGVDWLIGS